MHSHSMEVLELRLEPLPAAAKREVAAPAARLDGSHTQFLSESRSLRLWGSTHLASAAAVPPGLG